MSARLTWLGHSTFLLTTAGGKTILIDPWLAGNPKCPATLHDVACDAIVVTHGHSDHVGDAVSAAKRCGGPVVAIYELANWLQAQGIPGTKVVGMNKGGTTALDGLDVTVTMTDAKHSSSAIGPDGKITYLGEAAGYIIGMNDGLNLYVAGDTSLFGDMALLKELYAPAAAILPIGDCYTMDPRAAAHACRLLGVKQVVPCHYGTFPALTGTPERLRAELAALGLKVEVLAPEPGSAVTVG
jgi:L-ascorbate metabolism protein UlaG (beta-lactamase superfamily)